MTPKVIHCCWFGGKKTDLAERCLASWRKYAPDYEIRECNELPADAPVFVHEAFDRRQWAFVSDWMRFRLLYDFGGIYFDFGEELVGSLAVLPDGQWCAGEFRIDGSAGFAPGAGIALEVHSAVASAMLKCYASKGLDCKTTVGELLSRMLVQESGLSLALLPPEVLSPIDAAGVQHRTETTIGIHHYTMSWAPWWRKVLQWISWHGGRPAIDALLKVKHAFSNNSASPRLCVRNS